MKVVPEEDGYYRCFLEGADAEESRLFADSLDELLSPLANARYIIPRYIPVLSRSILDAVQIYLRQRARGRIGNAVVYHAIPDYLAANKERATVFAAAWNRYVSAGRPLYRSDPRAQGIIEAQGSENPFGVTAQMRTVWS